MMVGTEWLIEAAGCDAAALRNEDALRLLFDRVVTDLNLKVIDAIWHKFPGEGGVTGLLALTESHLAGHTYPEHGIATFNLYCCRTRPEWDWEENLKASLGAEHVSVSRIQREGQEKISDFRFENPNSAAFSDRHSAIRSSQSHTAGGDA
ncbi:MAG: S-adenosylmethionine decarboxylase [Acidobacteria bacterium]|nr:S-adenosylmethionine decarboxylase [Acidobacteriota bacterium]